MFSFNINELSDLPHTVLTVKININDIPEVVLIDTGASVSAIAEGTSKNKQLMTSTICINTVDSKFDVKYKDKNIVDFGGIKLHHEFIVIPKMKYSVILGNDFLRKYNIDIMNSKKLLVREEIAIPFFHSVNEVPEKVNTVLDVMFESEIEELRTTSARNNVYVKRNITIPAFSMHQIPICYDSWKLEKGVMNYF